MLVCRRQQLLTLNAARVPSSVPRHDSSIAARAPSLSPSVAQLNLSSVKMPVFILSSTGDFGQAEGARAPVAVAGRDRGVVGAGGRRHGGT